MKSAASTTRPFAMLLACIPVVDCVLNQINTAFHVSIGSLSLLQAIRLPMLMVLILKCGLTLYSRRGRNCALPIVAAGTFAMVAGFIGKEFLDTNAVAFTSLSAYGQLLYWVSFWTCVRLECREPSDAMLMLRGIVAAALVSAASIIIGHFAGGLNPYADDGVAASAGWFNTAKTITGVLLTGASLLLYMGARRRSFGYPLAALLCCGCCVITYARAGQVALGVMLMWLAGWCLLKPAETNARAVLRFLALAAVIALAVLPVVVRSNSFVTRWQDIQDDDKGGSGRATFWRVAVEDYENARPAEVAFGFGYDRMATMLYKDYGADIRHAHNDLLDMMLLGGVCGIAWWIALMGTFFWYATHNLRSYEGMAGVAIFLVFVCHGQLTGQLLGTDAMVAYSSALTCLATLRTEPQAQLRWGARLTRANAEA